MQIIYGDLWIRTRNVIGKPQCAYILNKEDDYLIKLSENFPDHGGKFFFVNKVLFLRNWKPAKGFQLNMFK